MTEPVKPQLPKLTCRDGCGRETTEMEAQQTAWRWLPISKRYRCPDCGRALDKVAK